MKIAVDLPLTLRGIEREARAAGVDVWMEWTWNRVVRGTPQDDMVVTAYRRGDMEQVCNYSITVPRTMYNERRRAMRTRKHLKQIRQSMYREMRGILLRAEEEESS